ncbi:MAG TPA: discoidin domain-containing protein [Bacteroidota bacterium]|nr:discoidin domain-containing protein [Bacteroidota bacterium]
MIRRTTARPSLRALFAKRALCVPPQAGLSLALLFLFSQAAFSQSRLLDDFSDISAWRPVTSEGARLTLSQAEGRAGKALVLNFDLSGVYGYAIAEKDFAFDLPDDYAFTFDMRGETQVNNFEFKLTDDGGNVYWIKKLDVTYPVAWARQRIRKRQITFAWGPAGHGTIRSVRKIEFVVSCGTGGKGRILIDNFRFEPVDDAAARAAVAEVMPAGGSTEGVPAIDSAGTLLGNWKSGRGEERASLQVDFHRIRDVGGLVIDWDSLAWASAYDVRLSVDGKEWTTAYSVAEGNGGRDYIDTHEGEGRYLRIDLNRSGAGRGYGIRRMEIRGAGFSETPNDFFHAIATDAPEGYYPRYFRDRQSYWTLMGASGDSKKALMSEDGAVEVGKGEFTIEPFLYIDNRLVSWSGVKSTQLLFDGYIPFPQVTWTTADGDWTFTIQGTAAGPAATTLLGLHYNLTARRALGKGKIFIAVRPFQVNPPWQSLNGAGGPARIDSIRYKGGFLDVNDETIVPMTPPSGFGAAPFDQGDVTDYLAHGNLPSAAAVSDHFGYASAALAYDFDLQADQEADVVIALPLHGWRRSPAPNMSAGSPETYYRLMTGTVAGRWQEELNRVRFTFPGNAVPVANTLRSQLAYMLINRNGPAIQPGSRNYDRSWIRDGALMCAALLRLGHSDEVRAYLDWYAKGQFPGGKIPCVIDARGPDATNEHDSNGEFIHAVREYFRFTGDTAWLRGKMDAVVRAARFIQSLREERKTAAYRDGTPLQKALYGIIPESISHEGYWDVPRHSYWDDFFDLRGIKDASAIAHALGEKTVEDEFAAERDDFRKDLYASMRLAMSLKGIDYIPGCAELGDFDPTSTTIGLDPGGELGNIPEPALHNTFEKYYRFFEERKSHSAWVNYTPYETRAIGAFVLLGQKGRAAEAMNFFMNDRRPPGWNSWAEVVWRNPDTPKYIGDLPHTWVGSDFIRSVLTMFAYERERDTALVLCAGIPDAWIADTSGVAIQGLRTYGGEINISLRAAGSRVVVEVSGTIDPAKWKLLLESPLDRPLKRLSVGGARRPVRGTEVRITRLPARVEFTY